MTVWTRFQQRFVTRQQALRVDNPNRHFGEDRLDIAADIDEMKQTPIVAAPRIDKPRVNMRQLRARDRDARVLALTSVIR